MTGVVLIIYLFNYTKQKARYLFVFVQRAYTDSCTRGEHREHEAAAWQASLSLATTNDSIDGLEDYTVPNEF